MKVTILDAYTPNDEEKANPTLFASNVRAYMAKEANVATTEHSYDDMLLQQDILNLVSKEFYFKPDFEMKVVKELFDLDLEQCKLLCTKFGSLVSDHKTGHMTMNDFKIAFGFDTGDYTEEFGRRMFSFFDTSDSGSIEFREFLQALSLLDRKTEMALKTKLSWLMFDSDCIGKVDKQALDAGLSKIAKNTEGSSPSVSPVSDAQFNECDLDKDGYLNMSEFEAFALTDERFIGVAVAFFKSRWGISCEEVRVMRTNKSGGDNNI